MEVVRDGCIDLTLLIKRCFSLEQSCTDCELFGQLRDNVIKVAIKLRSEGRGAEFAS